MTRQYLRLDAGTLAWCESATPVGPAPSEAADRVLVLIHAFPLNADMWEPQLDSPPEGWRVIAPDLRGFGASAEADGERRDERSRPGAALSLDDYARDIFALLDHLGVDRAVFAGLSMGGYTLFACHHLAPARVRGLVLADTKAEADSAEAREGRLRMIDLLERGGPAAVAAEMLPRLLGAATRLERPDVASSVRAMIEVNSASAIRDAIVRMMTRPDSAGALARIDCPTLVIVGDEDQVTPPVQAREMARRIPGAVLTVIAGAGHLSNLEQPQSFNRALHEFLRGVEG